MNTAPTQASVDKYGRIKNFQNKRALRDVPAGNKTDEEGYFFIHLILKLHFAMSKLVSAKSMPSFNFIWFDDTPKSPP